MDAFSPEIQAKCQKHEVKSVIGTAPTLVVIDKAYGDGAAKIWLSAQLADFNEFCGKKEKMDDWQIEQLANGIVTNFGFLKASEIMLFLYQYKMGQWGPIYGAVDPQELMVVLSKKFLPWRASVIEKAEGEKQMKEREQWAQSALKPSEIKALKERIKRTANSFRVNKF